MRLYPYPESSKNIRAHFKTALVDPTKESPKHTISALGGIRVNVCKSDRRLSLGRLIIEDDDGNDVKLHRLPQDRTALQCALVDRITTTQLNDNLRTVVSNIADHGRQGVLTR